MYLSDDVLLELVEVAKQAALSAGTLISSFRGKSFNIDYKSGGEHLASKVVTEVDKQSENLILEVLQPSIERYDLAILCEESEDDKLRLVKDYFWCIDPLDGTLAFTESKPGYSVSIALVSRNGESLIGVVYDPVEKTMYSAVKGHGVFRNGAEFKKCLESKDDKFTLPCDRSFVESEHYQIFIKKLHIWAVSKGFSGLELIHDGGAVMNACKVLEAAAGCYFKLPKKERGGGSLWDVAATICLFNEFGAHASDYYGLGLNLNNSETTFMNAGGVFFTAQFEQIGEIKEIIYDAIDCAN